MTNLAPDGAPPNDFWTRSSAGITLRVRLTPRASRTEVIGVRDGELCVRVTAAPVDSKANVALTNFLAKALGVGRTHVTIVRGETSRHKTVLVDDPKADVSRLT